CQLADGAVDARVVHHHVQAAQLRARPVYQALCLLGIGDIRLLRKALDGKVTRDGGTGRLQLSDAAGAEGDRKTSYGELARDGESDADGSAGDSGDEDRRA